MRSVQIYIETNAQMLLHVTVTSERKQLFSLVCLEVSGPGGAQIHQTSNSITENLKPGSCETTFRFQQILGPSWNTRKSGNNWEMSNDNKSHKKSRWKKSEIKVWKMDPDAAAKSVYRPSCRSTFKSMFIDHVSIMSGWLFLCRRLHIQLDVKLRQINTFTCRCGFIL